MGDRVSISFQTRGQESVALFSHWGGREFAEAARLYGDGLPRDSQIAPLDRREPNTVMVDFIRTITENQGPVRSDLYLGVDQGDGDNSDNGHFVINLD
tara:strand:+ start:280 stop:573 length:294 start_codon:yes stop_codon:yes gene_type:complete